jgi:hypothetical protein
VLFFYDFFLSGGICGGGKGLWHGHVLRLVVQGDILPGPSTHGASSLFERHVSFIDSLCRGLGFALATRGISCLGWLRCKI